MNAKTKTFVPVTENVRIQTEVINAIVQTAMRTTKTIFVWVSRTIFVWVSNFEDYQLFNFTKKKNPHHKLVSSMIKFQAR